LLIRGSLVQVQQGEPKENTEAIASVFSFGSPFTVLEFGFAGALSLKLLKRQTRTVPLCGTDKSDSFIVDYFKPLCYYIKNTFLNDWYEVKNVSFRLYELYN
ncbi:MAG: hypothetical protein MJ070_03220, partial [Lachnospiraceae bacterium]|nr:hypothetical protein [Lachnospiraceae bacterium]